MDLYNDPGHATLQMLFHRHPGAYDLVKHASFEDRRDQIPPSAFAWPERSSFPVHTPEHAVVSYLYAKHGSQQTKIATEGRRVPLVPKEVVAEIEEALDAYGISADYLEPVEEKVAALDPDECIFPEERLYPVRDAEEIKVAEERLLEQYRRMKPETRANAFAKLAEAAERHGVSLQPKSLQWAGQTVTDRAELAETLSKRAHMAKVAEHKDAYNRMAQAVMQDRMGLRDQVTRVKLASAIGDLDRMSGLERKVVDPVAAVFNTSMKVAAHMLDLGGQLVDTTKLASLPPSFFSDALGPDIVSEISSGGRVDAQKVAEVVNTLPADMKQDLARHLKAAGVQVVAG